MAESNEWRDTVQYGDREEQRIVEWLQSHHPNYEAQWVETHNVADVMTVRGGIEVKSYRMNYRIPSIESLCVDSGKLSVWLTDEHCSYVFCNHGYDIHVYDAQKLRQIYKKGWMLRTYTSSVSQGNGQSKTMEFLSLQSKSTNQSELHLEEDSNRWDCALLEDWSPYICSLKKDWSSFV